MDDADNAKNTSTTILRCKVIIIGDSKIGKSALTQVFHSGQYPKNYMMTWGVDFCVKSIKIPDSDKIVELYIFDVSGSEIYSRIRKTYYENCSLIMLCYDVSNKDSFIHCKQWFEEVSKVENKAIKGVLVGLKSDLNEYSQIAEEDILSFTEEYGLIHFQCSSLLSQDVDAPFNFLAGEFENIYEETTKNLKNGF